MKSKIRLEAYINAENAKQQANDLEKMPRTYLAKQSFNACQTKNWNVFYVKRGKKS